GDETAIERIAYEMCEDESRQGVAYFELRYSPHFFASTDGLLAKDFKHLSPERVVQCVTKGLQRGEKDFNVKARTILCCNNKRPDWSSDVLELCKLHRNEGVVGIDCSFGEPTSGEYDQRIVDSFLRAKELGIHRTCHAGESPNSSKNIAFAIDKMFAERIGHGYHVVEDADLYESYKHRVHFETCPVSSYLTGAVTSNFNNGKHPIVQFAEDNVSFSISKDDTTMVQTTLDDEYKYLMNLGLTEAYFVKSNLNSAKASFLPKEEKIELINDILNAYGIFENMMENIN
ncbi:Adenosine deaminase-like protein, partial [Dinothrombium tinctorium]